MLAVGRISCVVVLALSSVACTVASGDEEESLVSADESIELGGQIAGNLTAGTTVRTTDPLNLRTGPSTSNAVITVMPAGASLKLVSGTPNNNFYQVSYNGQTGWASGTYLSQSTKTLQATEDVYLRSGPGTTYSILQLVPDGGKVTLLDSTAKNGFYNVSYNGQTGWSSAAYYTTPTATAGSSSCSVSVTPLYCKVPYINQISSSGTADDWNKYSNCGPTSMAMIARAFGYRPELSDGSLVNLLGSFAGIGAAGAGADQIATIGRRMGKTATVKWGADAVWIKSQLSAGRLVAINGNRTVTLKYDNNASTSGTGIQGHWIVGAGITSAGNVLVKDPSVPGVSQLTPAQLNEFIRMNYNGDAAVSIGN